MRLTDLELYRWKFHNDIYIHTQKNWRPDTYPMMSWRDYWMEHGAFVSVLPRQTGKTEMLCTIIKHAIEEKEDYIVVCLSKMMRLVYRAKGLDQRKIIKAMKIRKGYFDGRQHENINLFVDEFDYIDRKNHLCHALNHPWRSVTMVSSLK